MTTLEANLVAVRQTLAAGWTQGSDARDAEGREVPLGDPRATQHCLAGAVDKTGGRTMDVWRALLSATSFRIPGSLVKWNDSPERTKAEVLALVDRAIDLVRTGAFRTSRDEIEAMRRFQPFHVEQPISTVFQANAWKKNAPGWHSAADLELGIEAHGHTAEEAPSHLRAAQQAEREKRQERAKVEAVFAAQGKRDKERQAAEKTVSSMLDRLMREAKATFKPEPLKTD